jgi:hypothetical protein
MIDLIKKDLKLIYNTSWVKNLNHITVIEFIIYFIMLFRMNNGLLFVNMMAIDSTISAAIFVNAMIKHTNNIRKEYANEQTCNTEIYRSYYKQYESINHLFDFESSSNNKGVHSTGNTIRKYFLFFLCQLASWVFTLVLNSWFMTIVNGLLLLLAIPFFAVGLLLLKKFVTIYTTIAKIVRRFVRYIVSKITAKAINSVCRACLNIDPNIDHNEMYKFYEHSESSIGNSLMFIKTAVVTSYIHYLKKTDNIFYYSVVNFVQKYQMNDLISLPGLPSTSNIITQKVSPPNIEILRNIIKKRKWNEFLQPKTIHMIFELYGVDGDDTLAEKIGRIYDIIVINGIRFSTLWTLSTIHPIVAIIIDIYFTQNVKQFVINKHIIPYTIASVIMCFFPLFGSFLMVTSDIIMKHVIEYVIEHTLTYFVERSIKRPEKFKYLLLSPLIVLFKYWSFGIPLILVGVYKQKNRFSFASSIVILLSVLSDFSMPHQVILWTTYVVFFDILEYSNDIESQVVKAKTIKLDVIDEYEAVPPNKFQKLISFK